MTRSVLVPVDGSDPARNALEYATNQFPEADITALHILDPAVRAAANINPDDPLASVSPSSETHGSEVIESARQRAVDNGVEIDTETVAGGPGPAETIIEYAEKHEVDEVVIGSHSRQGAKRLLFGSVAEEVVRNTPMPCTVVP